MAFSPSGPPSRAFKRFKSSDPRVRIAGFPPGLNKGDWRSVDRILFYGERKGPNQFPWRKEDRLAHLVLPGIGFGRFQCRPGAVAWPP